MTTNANNQVVTTQTTQTTNTQTTLEAKIIQGGLLLGELAAEIKTALKSTEGKAMECTKHAYKVGIEHLNDTAGVQAQLDACHIKLKDGYIAETHFFAIVKLFSKHAGVTINSGEISRIATSCKKAYSDGVGVNDIESYINVLGGVRKFYESIAKKSNPPKTPCKDSTPVDPNLVLKVFSGSQFLGILNLDAKAIAKLIATHGLKPTSPTNPGNDNNTPPSNDGGGAPIDSETDAQDVVDTVAADIEIQTAPTIDQVLIPNAIQLGDCIEFMKTLPDQSVDAIISSPPYANQRKKLYGGIDESAYPAWTVAWLEQAKRILKPNGNVAINIRPHHKHGQISDYTLKTRLAIRENGWREVDEIIWDKVSGVSLGSPRLPRRCWESIHWFSLSTHPYNDPKANGNPSNAIGFTATKGVGTYIGGISERKDGIARCTDIVRVPTSACDKSKFNTHPAQYPEALAAWLIRLLVPEGGVVFDPFMGGGTTAVAAVRNGRQFIGSELKQEYIDIANQRLATVSPPSTNDNTEIQQTQTKEIQHG